MHSRPLHPYSQMLVASNPEPGPRSERDRANHPERPRQRADPRGEAARRQKHDRQEQQANPEIPVRRILPREIVLHEDVQRRAEKGAVPAPPGST